MIDIVIPCSKADVKLLPLCVQGVRENVADGVGDIYVVAPYTKDIEGVCNIFGLNYVNEREYMGFGKEDLKLPSLARPAWIYQQLIKLNAYTLPVSEDFLVIDADHVLLKEHRFVQSSFCHKFYVRDEYHKPYFDAIEQLFGGSVKRENNFSYISDKMLLNRVCVLDMLEEIESHCKCSWIEAIQTKCPDEYNNFSEYETYANWFYARKGWKCMDIEFEIRFAAGGYIHLSEANYNELKQDFGELYDSITQMKY